MKKLPFSLKSKRKQQGIALIFALAMLALLLIMAMGFATNSIFMQKAAYNSTNTTTARLLCQTAASRVLALLYQNGESIDYSCDATASKDIMLNHLTTKIGDAAIYSYNSSDPVAWEYIKSSDGTNTRLIGRFAYKVIPVAGLDPGALVRNDVNEAAVTAAEQRLGIYASEMNLKAVSSDIVAASPTATQVDAQKFNYNSYAAAVGVYPGTSAAPGTSLATSVGWQSFKNLFALTGITDTGLQAKFLRWFMLDTDRFKSKEQYRVDQPVPTFYHRFNITRNWTNDFPAAYPPTVMYDKILLDTDGNGTPDIDLTNPPAAMSYSSSGTSDGYGIPWLAYFGYDKDGNLDNTLKGTFASVINRRRQIAANLVDYGSSSAVPTSDQNPANWGTTDPTFAGNKKTPYLNEFGLHFQVTAVRSPNFKNITVSIAADMTAELIDIYGITTMSDATVRVYYTVSYNFTGTAGIAVPAAIAGTSQYSDISIPATRWSSVIKRYATPSGWTFIYPTTIRVNNVAVNKNTNVSIVVNPAVTINKVILSYNGVNVDLAKVNTVSTSQITVSLPKNKAQTLFGNYFVSFQTNDPRQNLNIGDWYKTENTVVGVLDYSVYNSGAQGTLNSKNKFNGSLINPSGGPDSEGTDPAYDNSAGTPGLSTAYVRQGPIQSPWELGLIHRGAAWETINLKKFNPDKSNKFVAINVPSASYPYARIPGGAIYADGDANILDQIKMDKTLDNFKVNINSLYKDPDTAKYTALETLFTNIKTGCTDKSAPSTGTPIAPTDIFNGSNSSLIKAITDKTKVTPYTNRAQVVNDIVAALPISNYTTDAKKEEIIGKFINLTDVSGKYFYVIVMAQAIKDIGNVAGININKKYNDGNVVKTVKFDGIDAPKARSGNFDVVKKTLTDGSEIYVYADEIIAEQKIRILVYLEPPYNVPKILSYEFIE